VSGPAREGSVHRPHRGDDVEAWLKRKRDELNAEIERLNAARNSEAARMAVMRFSGRDALDDLLDRYRECSDYGLSLRAEDEGAGDP
jgi:hypothetical protein